ncbi:MAG: HD domain-containing phosphohydrolase [Pseudothermotoga sp.]
MNLNILIPLISFVELFNKMNHLEYRNFVKHSLQVAKITYKLSKMLNLQIDSECSYLAGMLHDMGLVMKASIENYDLFVDMFRRVPDLEKIVLTFDKGDHHSVISYAIGSLVKPLCPNCAKSILYHHTPYQNIPESDPKIVYLANCLKVADLISLTALRNNAEELTVDLYNEMVHTVTKDVGILEEIKKAALAILIDYKVICEILDEQNRFSSDIKFPLEDFEEAARLLATLLDLRSPYTRNHTFVTAKLSERIISELLGKEDARVMNIAALLHDIGKLKTPLSVLHKRRRLDQNEFMIMKRHVVDTYKMLEEAGLAHIAKISASHHERLDGSGYPTGLKSDQMTIFQRTIQVADVFSALIEHRPYREKMSMTDALQVIENEVNEGRLDPTVYNKLKELVKNRLFDEELIFRNALEHLFKVSYSEIKEMLGRFVNTEG